MKNPHKKHAIAMHGYDGPDIGIQEIKGMFFCDWTATS
jgi:hypothetical protein